MGLRRLWAGELSLDDAFWNWAVIGGIAVNLVTGLLYVVLLSLGRPVAALVAGYGVAVPYNVVATVGVWRSAARDPRSPARANTYRAVTLVGMVILTVL